MPNEDEEEERGLLLHDEQGQEGKITRSPPKLRSAKESDARAVNHTQLYQVSEKIAARCAVGQYRYPWLKVRDAREIDSRIRSACSRNGMRDAHKNGQGTKERGMHWDDR